MRSHTQGTVAASRRYHVAAQCLQGILAGCDYTDRGPSLGLHTTLTPREAAALAVGYADALLAALAEPPAPTPPAPDELVDLGAECAAADPRTGYGPANAAAALAAATPPKKGEQ
jgi:hypothetical protein